jgi:AsmA family protein
MPPSNQDPTGPAQAPIDPDRWRLRLQEWRARVRAGLARTRKRLASLRPGVPAPVVASDEDTRTAAGRNDATAARRPGAGAIVFALLLAGIVALVLAWDWNWFKGLVERQVEARTGRSFEIGGDLGVELGRTSRVVLDDIRFGNAQWSEEPTMGSARRLRVAIELWPLLRREIRIPYVALQQPRLRLEKGPGGVGNWEFGRRGEGPQFRRLWVGDGQVHVLDPAGDTDYTLHLQSRAPDTPGAANPIALEGGGRWQGDEFKVEGTAQSPMGLRDRDAPYAIDVRASAGATRAHARGTLLDPLRLRGLDLQLQVAGKDLAHLYPLLGLAMPSTPPYQMEGRLTREGSVWRYQDFAGKVGDSDLAGTVSIDTAGERNLLRGDLRSRRLDLDDLGGFIGAGPGDAPRKRAPGRVLPDTPYELDKLRAMDADVRLRAQRLVAPGLPLEDMDARLLLEAGVATLDPLDFGVAGGRVRSTIRMDAREDTIRTRAQASLRGIELPRLLPNAEMAKGAAGKLSGDVSLAGHGNSVARMLGNADGDVGLGLGRGRISNLTMEWAGLDIAEALKFMVMGDRQIPIRCAFADFAVAGGTMTARALAFDTTDTIIVGEGTVSLRDETLDLTLRPRPKDRSLFAFRSPLLLTGTFADPSFRPDMARVGLRAGIALALATIAPPAALLATLELGPGEDANCGGRYAK